MPGESLDDALNRYGPGAIGDLLPRVRALAEALDQAAAVTSVTAPFTRET